MLKPQHCGGQRGGTPVFSSPNVLRITKLFYKQLGRRHAYKNTLIIQFTTQVHYCQALYFCDPVLRNSLLSISSLVFLGKVQCTFTITEAQHLYYSLYSKTLFSDFCCSNVILNMLNTLYTHRTNIPFNHTHMHYKMCTPKIALLLIPSANHTELLYTTPVQCSRNDSTEARGGGHACERWITKLSDKSWTQTQSA